MSKRAAGTFNVNLTPRPPQDGDDAAFGRFSISKQFQGALDGRRGTFVLAHRGTRTRDSQQLSVIVVPMSGTDELAGLEGTMGIHIADKQHFYEFDYRLPDEADLVRGRGEG